MTTRRKYKLYSHFETSDDSLEVAITRIASDISFSHSTRKTPILSINDPTILSIILYILNKKTRSKNELLILQCMLESFDSFIQGLKYADSYKDILINISLVLTYEESLGNSLLFRFGESGDKFYIILKGKVSILLPKEFTASLDYFSYIKYLTYLFYIKEKELLINILISNMETFYIDKDTFFKEMSEYKSLLFRKKETLISKFTFTLVSIEQQTEFALFINKVFSYSNAHSIIFSSDEYIQLVSPDMNVFYSNNSYNENKHKVVLLTYTTVSVLGIGESFGEIALQQKNKNIRTASVIVNEPSIFAVLNKETYYKCIREYQKKQRLLKLKFFSELTLFTNVSHRNFELKYFNYFLYKTIPLDTQIIQQGTLPTKVYIIRSGTFEITTFMSYDFLNTIYTHKTVNKSLMKAFATLNEEQMKVKQNMRITILNANDIVGLDDLLYKGHYFVNVKCISKESEVYVVDYDNLKNMIDNSLTLRNNYDKAMDIRNNILCKRMEDIAMYLNTVKKENYKLDSQNDVIKRIIYNREEKDCKSKSNATKKNKAIVLNKNTLHNINVHNQYVHKELEHNRKSSGNVIAYTKPFIPKLLIEDKQQEQHHHHHKSILSDNYLLNTPTTHKHVNMTDKAVYTTVKPQTSRSKFLSFEKMLKTIIGPKLRKKRNPYKIENENNSTVNNSHKLTSTLLPFQSLQNHEDSSIGIKRVLFFNNVRKSNIHSYRNKRGEFSGNNHTCHSYVKSLDDNHKKFHLDFSEKKNNSKYSYRKYLLKSSDHNDSNNDNNIPKTRKYINDSRHKYPVKAYLLRPMSKHIN